MLKPFISYFGSKYNKISKYPQPKYKTIIEPFAGSASYSTHYDSNLIILNEISPSVFGVWDYLTKVTENELRNLPLEFENLDDVRGISWGARCLISYWMKPAQSKKCNIPAKWMSNHSVDQLYWGQRVIERLCKQIKHIRHWKVIQGSYLNLDQNLINDSNITWFVDPPYQGPGKNYKYHDIDYSQLADWCQSLKGQIIVCEQEGANWLPFQHLTNLRNTIHGKRNNEVIWTRNCGIINTEEGCWKI